MRRRGKRGPNNSEATGKVGQELPQLGNNELAPLRPAYPDDNFSSNTNDGDDAPEAQSDAPDGPVAEGDAEASAGATGRRRRRRRRRGGAGRSTAPAVAASGGEDAASDFDAEAGIGADDEPSDDSEAGDDNDHSGRMEHETQPAELGTPPAAAPAVAARAPKGFVVLAIGLPGSGKTTWFKRRAVTPLSSDMLRNILFDDITEQRYQGLVFSTLRSLLRARLVARMPWNYVDATNLSPHERRQWIKMAKSFGYDVQAVFFDVPLEVCLERNQKRERRVGDDVMRTMAARLKPPHFREGFSKITVVRVKPKDGAAAGAPESAADHEG